MPASLRKHGRQGRLEADPDEAHDASSEQGPSLASDDQPSRPSRRSLRSLDWFVFFLADTQMGFGPLVANVIGPKLMGETFKTATGVDFRSLFLVPFSMAVAAALILLLFFHPPQKNPAAVSTKH